MLLLLTLTIIIVIFAIYHFSKNKEGMKQAQVAAMVFDNDEINVSNYMGNAIVPKIDISRGTRSNRGFSAILK